MNRRGSPHKKQKDPRRREALSRVWSLGRVVLELGVQFDLDGGQSL